MNKWRLACPACNSEDHLLIGAIQWMRATPKGFEESGKPKPFGPTSRIRCERCGYNGFYHELKTGA